MLQLQLQLVYSGTGTGRFGRSDRGSVQLYEEGLATHPPELQFYRAGFRACASNRDALSGASYAT